MSVETLQLISLVSFIVAAIFLLIGIALFFLFNIPKIYGDISGKTARKAIQNIRQQNESTGNKAYKPSAVNVERGKLTDKISKSGNLVSTVETHSGIGVGTEELVGETTALATETTMLETKNDETTILNADTNETTILTSIETNVSSANEESVSNADTFEVTVEIGFTGSSELIE